MAGPFISNARMYAVTPRAEAAWRELLDRVIETAGLPQTMLGYMPYPAPQPLEELWRRPDLGCVFMCGYPIALRLADVVPIAAPVPDADWAQGRAAYRSDLIVRADSPFRTFPETFGGRLGWTVEHSHSGFNALRYHLLAYRTPRRPTLYRQVVGHLVTARKILDSVVDGTIDVGPLDGYWHMLIRESLPDLTAKIRVVDSTALAPMPAFVAGARMPKEAVTALRSAFAAATDAPWFPAIAAELRLKAMQPMTLADYTVTLERDQAARAAGYPFPA
ncbi:MAG: phosphate/phosphite/phosphonate ABC transporter substrate-binding protein [Labrys sp. (in: a-proteobacteria)]